MNDHKAFVLRSRSLNKTCNPDSYGNNQRYYNACRRQQSCPTVAYINFFNEETRLHENVLTRGILNKKYFSIFGSISSGRKSWACKLKVSLIYSRPLITIDCNYPPKPGIFPGSSTLGQCHLTDAPNGTENCLFRRHRDIVCIFFPRVLNLCTFPILASICSLPDMDKSQLFTVGHDKNTQPKGTPNIPSLFICGAAFTADFSNPSHPPT